MHLPIYHIVLKWKWMKNWTFSEQNNWAFDMIQFFKQVKKSFLWQIVIYQYESMIYKANTNFNNFSIDLFLVCFKRWFRAKPCKDLWSYVGQKIKLATTPKIKTIKENIDI